MQIKDYVKPELLVVAVVLYFIGMWLKQRETVKDKYIPLINGLIGVADLCHLCVRHLCLRQWSGYRAGSFHGTYTGRPCGGIVYVCKPDF